MAPASNRVAGIRAVGGGSVCGRCLYGGGSATKAHAQAMRSLSGARILRVSFRFHKPRRRLSGALPHSMRRNGIIHEIRHRGSRFDKLANLPFVENRPTAETAQALRDEFLLSSTR